MRDRTIEAVTGNILQTLPEGHAYGRAHLKSAAIPPGIRHFLLKTLDRRSALEASSLLDVESEWFDAADAQFREALQVAVHRLRETAHFPASEWPRAVQQAVEEVLDYLIAPIPMLVDFVFTAEESSVSAADLRRRSGYFSDHAYIGRAVDAYLERREIQRVARGDFASTLSHVDRKMAAEKTPDEWVELLRPLERLISFGDERMNGIPVDFLVRFLEIKGREDLAGKISSRARASGASIVTMSTFRTMLAESTVPDPVVGHSAQNPPEPAASRPAPPGSREPGETAEGVPLWKRFQKLAPEAGSAPVRSAEPEAGAPPLWKQYQDQPENSGPRRSEGGQIHALDRRDDARGEQAPNHRSDTRGEQALAQNEQYRPRRDRVQAGSLSGHSAPDLGTLEMQVLGAAASRRKLFVRELFEGDTDRYEQALRMLNDATSWSDASRLVADQVFRPRRIDIYSEPAVAFTNAVERRFRESDN